MTMLKSVVASLLGTFIIHFSIILAGSIAGFVITSLPGNTPLIIWREVLKWQLDHKHHSPHVDKQFFSGLGHFEKEDNWKAIRDEFREFARDNRIPDFGEFDLGEEPPYEDMYNDWKVVFLKALGKDMPLMREHYFPKTYSLLDEMGDNVTTAMFSILEPNKVIQPHYGMFKSVVRYHLGIDVPCPNKSFILFPHKNVLLRWENGKAIMFDDTYLHMASNNGCDNPRVVLFLDVKRPLKQPFAFIDSLILKLAPFHPTARKFMEEFSEKYIDTGI